MSLPAKAITLDFSVSNNCWCACRRGRRSCNRDHPAHTGEGGEDAQAKFVINKATGEAPGIVDGPGDSSGLINSASVPGADIRPTVGG